MSEGTFLKRPKVVLTKRTKSGKSHDDDLRISSAILAHYRRQLEDPAVASQLTSRMLSPNAEQMLQGDLTDEDLIYLFANSSAIVQHK